jgi:hypothetical protein
VRRRLTDGKVRTHWYHRPTKIKLPPPDSAEFQPRYAAAEQQWAAQLAEKSVSLPPGTTSELPEQTKNHSPTTPEQRRKSPPLAPSGQSQTEAAPAPSAHTETKPSPVAQAKDSGAPAPPKLVTQKVAPRMLRRQPEAMLFDELLTEAEVVERYRNTISAGTFKNWRSAKTGPAFLKIGRQVFYPLGLLEQWERSHTLLCDLVTASNKIGDTIG